MKYLIILLLFSFSAKAQLTVTDYAVHLETDTLTIAQAFDVLRKATPIDVWYIDFYVVKDDIVYYRPKTTLMRKDRAIIIDGMKSRKVRI